MGNRKSWVFLMAKSIGKSWAPLVSMGKYMKIWENDKNLQE